MTGTRAVVVVGALLLAGCGSAATPSAAGTPSSTRDPSSLSGREIDLQLRPVLDAQPASGAVCTAPSPSRSTDAASTADEVAACAADGSVLYTLGPAVVTGTQWDSLRVDSTSTDGSTQIDALADPVGASALTKATADLSTNDEPQNQLAVYAEGVVLAAPTVVQPIYGGALAIAGADEASAQQLVDRLTG